MNHFDLTPDLIYYASCPRCYNLYPPKTQSNPRYPEFCNYQEFRGERRCGERLIKRKEPGKPTAALHPYTYQPLDSWLGKLLSRPGLIESMEKTTSPWNKITSVCRDIFGGKALREFFAADQKTLFLDTPQGELRLILNLNIDWFNPFGNKISGKHCKVGGIYMVCMNLPPYLRYRVENVYLVGIIPGPGEPSLHHLNHLLRPLVNDLLRFWHPGVYFSQTASHTMGVLVRCALLAVICDLPALRKTAGFAGVGAHRFCSFCRLLDSQIQNFDVNCWPQWTRDQHMAAAKQWKDAPTHKEREAEFAKHGIRWSELLRLSYEVRSARCNA